MKKRLSRYDVERVFCEAIQLHFNHPMGLEMWIQERLAEKLHVTESKFLKLYDGKYAALASYLAEAHAKFDRAVEEIYLPETTPEDFSIASHSVAKRVAEDAQFKRPK